jgi:galactokinase
MSRSASLALNLILSLLDANGLEIDDPLRIVDLAQAVENDYIGSPCGQLDQIMILFAKEGMGTHYNPRDSSVSHVPLGENAEDFRIVGLDTGTVRPGLEKSTYKLRRAECDEFAALLGQEFGVCCLADVRSDELYDRILDAYGNTHPDHCDRLTYIFRAQQRFSIMLEAWKAGDVETVGRVFREDGLGLRDEYKISGPELETMCDIARTVPGVLGERMLGGGDKGAAGALVRTSSVKALAAAIQTGYPRSHPAFADAFAVHVCTVVDGITTLDETP